MNQHAVGFILVGLLPISNLGWWGFGHYRVAKEISDTVGGVDPNYAMGPDSLRSHDILFNITTDFTWSHAVLRSGESGKVPLVPFYPHDGRYPGSVMYDLVSKKMTPETLASIQGLNSWEQDPLETAKGFIVHNAADSIVHWEYFLGGVAPVDCPSFLTYMWAVNHAEKEEWASYVILVSKDARTNNGTGVPVELFRDPGLDNVMGNFDDTFASLTEDLNGNDVLDAGEDQNGNGLLDDYIDDVFGPEEPDGERHLRSYLLSMHQIDYRTNASLMRLAMKVHRKNRRKTDTSGPSAFTVSGLESIVDSFQEELVSNANNELAAMTYSRFEALNDRASEVNLFSHLPTCAVPAWQPSEVMDRYNQSVARGAAWLANIGN